jgi:hypothetical protein
MKLQDQSRTAVTNNQRASVVIQDTTVIEEIGGGQRTKEL